MLAEAIGIETNLICSDDLLDDIAETLAVADPLPCHGVLAGIGEACESKFHECSFQRRA